MSESHEKPPPKRRFWVGSAILLKSAVRPLLPDFPEGGGGAAGKGNSRRETRGHVRGH